jgi:hypothetical protein
MYIGCTLSQSGGPCGTTQARDLVSEEGFACGHFLLATCTESGSQQPPVYVVTGILSPVEQ